MTSDRTTLTFKKYQKPIGTYCRLYHKWVGMEVADLEAEMYVVLHGCVLKYNPDNGASFNTFLWGSIYNRFRSIMRYQSAAKRNGTEIPYSPLEMDPDQDLDLVPNLDLMAYKNGHVEATTEDTFFAIMRVSEMVEDPKMQSRIQSSRQFAHVPA